MKKVVSALRLCWYDCLLQICFVIAMSNEFGNRAGHAALASLCGAMTLTGTDSDGMLSVICAFVKCASSTDDADVSGIVAMTKGRC